MSFLLNGKSNCKIEQFVNVKTHRLRRNVPEVRKGEKEKKEREELWNKLDKRTQDFLNECKQEFNSEVMRICYTQRR